MRLHPLATNNVSFGSTTTVIYIISLYIAKSTKSTTICYYFFWSLNEIRPCHKLRKSLFLQLFQRIFVPKTCTQWEWNNLLRIPVLTTIIWRCGRFFSLWFYTCYRILVFCGQILHPFSAKKRHANSPPAEEVKEQPHPVLTARTTRFPLFFFAEKEAVDNALCLSSRKFFQKILFFSNFNAATTTCLSYI